MLIILLIILLTLASALAGALVGLLMGAIIMLVDRVRTGVWTWPKELTLRGQRR